MRLAAFGSLTCGGIWGIRRFLRDVREGMCVLVAFGSLT